MALRAVVFDIGGVLEHNVDDGERRWLEQLGLSKDEFSRRMTPISQAGAVGEIDLAEAERRIAAAFALDDVDLRAFMEDIWTDYVGTLNEPVATYFASLRGRYRTGIVSNSFVGARERELPHGFEEMCDVLVYSHEVGCAKPDPTIYLMACERLRVRPREALFVDDGPNNVAGARAIGMEAIQFTDSEQALAEVRARLDRG